MVSALAANFGLSVYSLNLANFNDRTLMNAINQVAPNSVLLFEEIDCMKTAKIRDLPTAGPDSGGQTRGEKEKRC